MSYVYYNPNPRHKRTSDCVIRALAKALDMDWQQSYITAATQGLDLADMPDQGVVWRSLLRRHGFRSHVIPDSCPDCYTVRNFAIEYPVGTYVLAIAGTPNHVVTVVDGDWYDTWDSGDELPMFYMGRD